jgi:hypothetical protein
MPDDCFVFLREAGGEQVLVALNFTDQDRLVRLPAGDWTVLVSTHQHRELSVASGSLFLRSFEGCALRLA